MLISTCNEVLGLPFPFPLESVIIRGFFFWDILGPVLKIAVTTQRHRPNLNSHDFRSSGQRYWTLFTPNGPLHLSAPVDSYTVLFFRWLGSRPNPRLQLFSCFPAGCFHNDIFSQLNSKVQVFWLPWCKLFEGAAPPPPSHPFKNWNWSKMEILGSRDICLFLCLTWQSYSLSCFYVAVFHLRHFLIIYYCQQAVRNHRFDLFP